MKAMASGKLPKIKLLIMHHFIENDSLVGYSFRKALSDKGISISNGSLYPILKELEVEGYLISTFEGRKKVYSQTAKSKKAYDQIMHLTPEDVSIYFMRLVKTMPTIDWYDKGDIALVQDVVSDLARSVKRVKAKKR